MNTINVANDFYFRLVNRNKYQGDGLHHAEEFRNKYLSDLDKIEAWSDDNEYILLDFKNVKKIGPSFANEAFAFFTKYAKPEQIFKKISFKNLTKVQDIIIRTELEAGYSSYSS